MRKIYGVGINDSEVPVHSYIGGKDVMCRAYSIWKSVLRRCYDKPYQEKDPSYKGCSVSEDWFYFSNFKMWMDTQDNEGKQLDKDLLVKGNKVYSADTCIFVSNKVNTFICERVIRKVDLPVGVTMTKFGKYRSTILSGGKRLYLGNYSTAKEAHEAWWKHKCQLAEKLASEQSNPIIANAIRTRYKGPSFCYDRFCRSYDREET